MLIKGINPEKSKENDEDINEDFKPASEQDIIDFELAKEGGQEGNNAEIVNRIKTTLEMAEKNLFEKISKKPKKRKQDLPDDKMIDKCIEIALAGKPEDAVKMIKDTKNPDLIDAFHDRLIKEIQKKEAGE
jgi:hypothetical protein